MLTDLRDVLVIRRRIQIRVVPVKCEAYDLRRSAARSVMEAEAVHSRLTRRQQPLA